MRKVKILTPEREVINPHGTILDQRLRRCLKFSGSQRQSLTLGMQSPWVTPMASTIDNNRAWGYCLEQKKGPRVIY